MKLVQNVNRNIFEHLAKTACENLFSSQGIHPQSSDFGQDHGVVSNPLQNHDYIHFIIGPLILVRAGPKVAPIIGLTDFGCWFYL